MTELAPLAPVVAALRGGNRRVSTWETLTEIITRDSSDGAGADHEYKYTKLLLFKIEMYYIIRHLTLQYVMI